MFVLAAYSQGLEYGMCQQDQIPMHPDGGLFHGGAVGIVTDGTCIKVDTSNTNSSTSQDKSSYIFMHNAS